MFSLHNESNEVLEVVQIIDESAPGCRVINEPITTILQPDDYLCSQGYEPGISYVIRPQKDPEQYRGYNGWESIGADKQETNSGVDGKSGN